MKRMRVTHSELVKANTPDWLTSPGCQKLRAAIREIYDAPSPWHDAKMSPMGDKADAPVTPEP